MIGSADRSPRTSRTIERRRVSFLRSTLALSFSYRVSMF